MKPRKTMRERAIEMTVEGIVKEVLQGVQISIFDLSKVSDAGKAAAIEYIDNKAVPDYVVETAIKAAVDQAVAKLRKN